jgi:receptor protein-tyrosine kinase
MLIPKASHLVERVAERLLRSGPLEDPAARLLPASSVTPADHIASEMPVTPPEVAASTDPSSLFAPSPTRPVPSLSDALSGPPLGVPISGAGVPLGGLGPVSADEATPADYGSVATAAPLGSPGISGQSVAPGRTEQSVTLDRPTDRATSVPPLDQSGRPADPALGTMQTLPSIDAMSLERAGMIDWSRTRTRISEEFRLVQRQIIRSAFGPGAEPGLSNLLLVTSARPGEGKSFMSTNLAGSIARQGDNHVLLVDADSKRDSICYNLGLGQARGLLDLAADPKLDPAPLIVRTPIQRLSILPVGRERERSAELFSTKEMTRLIQALGRRYADRLLILDAPPCLSTSDPAVLAPVVGQILFVVEADRTQREEIEASLDLIQACPTITLVLNKQQVSSRYTFGAYSSYYSS